MSASPHATIEELEALARGELATAQAVSIDAHLADCESCQRELAWLRAESNLLSRRPRPSLPPQLWHNIEAQLPVVKPSLPPLQIQPARSTQTPPPRRRSQVAQWFAVAAAAAAMLMVYSVGGAPLGRLRQSVASLFGTPTTPKVIIEVSGSHDPDDSPPVSTEVKVSGAVTLRVSTLSADVQVVAGDRERVRMEVTDSSRKKVELRSEGQGELRALFDGNQQLESGHVKLEVPPGSRIEVMSTSGSLSTSGIGGDVIAHTASGDLHISNARKLEIHTASGDLTVDGFSGTAQIRTASGDAHITRGSAPISAFDWNSASGELSLEGRCADDCRMNLNTVSGDVELHTSADSSYTATFHTMTGELEGSGSGSNKHGDDDDDDVMPPKDRTVRVGAGVGAVHVNTVSGDLTLGSR